ncbi:hypothetical protein N7452_002158 [Penicillium brevicompactum]|uniref:SprT-like domain-containing protein n=1 Tax=Penicillium brevicompactum TaxID=5074 RepID=A0A9W9UQV0_PENBR|nr:hypothetical protein N7452_002158 [Penicillium brevicompactum]
MARLNTANPLVYGTPHRGSKDTPSISNPDSQSPSNQPYPNTTKSPNKHDVPKPPNQNRRQLARSSTLFNILPDDESASESEIGSQPAGKQTRPRTLGIARVNSLLLPKTQRPRPTFMRTAGYDKENDVPEHSTDEHRSPGSTSTRQPPTRRHVSQTPSRSRAREIDRPQPMHEDQEEESDQQSLDDSLGSLDDFIVSDNEEPSSHEESDHETPDTEEEPTPPPSPVRSPRKRLMRGRRPPSETEPTTTTTTPPSRESERSKTPDNRSRAATPEDLTTSPVLESKRESVGYEVKIPEYLNVSTNPSHSRLRNSDDLIQHLEDLDLSSEEEDTPQPEASMPILDSEEDLPSSVPPGRKHSTPLTPSTARAKDTPPTTIRAQKKAEAARKRELRAQVAEFNENKIGFAEEFLQHLDGVFDGRIASMTKDTGGIKLIWTKNFRNTAGRATVRSERVFTREGGVEDPGRRRYNATIELSEKVLDTEDKILCTLTHEYCHLLDILITENRGKGAAQHGVSFKQWGARCTQALKDHPVYGGRVEVTTKHTYEINHKGYLKQIKPVPRAPPKRMLEKW